MSGQRGASAPGQKTGLLGSLKDALAAAGRAEREDGAVQDVSDAEPDAALAAPMQLPPPVPVVDDAADEVASIPPAAERAGGTGMSAAEAARTARGERVSKGAIAMTSTDAPSTTRAIKGTPVDGKPPETQLVRGRQKVERGVFKREPVVGWLVVVGGPGIGAFRPIYEGNNTVGRSSTQRIPLDFGDDAISSEEQAYIRYDSSDRSFLFVPNLAKTNVVSLNDKRPTGAVELRQMDVIVIGRTQLVFVPFCGPDFDWSELADAKG